MSANTAVEILIGLSFVYLLLSIVCSALHEAAAGILALRQNTLLRGIAALLQSPDLQRLLYQHPLIQSLSHGTGGRKLPSYIPSEIFSAALQDLRSQFHKASSPQPPAGLDAEQWKETLSKGTDHLNRVLDALLAGSKAGENLIQQQRQAIGAWFDAAMDRVSGAYKRQSQAVLAALALVVTVGLNADSLLIGRAFWTQPQFRAAIADKAADWTRQQAPASGASGDFVKDWKEANSRFQKASTELDALSLPIGWIHCPSGGEWLGKIIGLLFTAIAVSLGAPFWFDTLNKLVNLRASGKPPTKPSTS